MLEILRLLLKHLDLACTLLLNLLDCFDVIDLYPPDFLMHGLVLSFDHSQTRKIVSEVRRGERGSDQDLSSPSRAPKPCL